MSITVSMPQLGETVTEGTILRWAKQPGDTVAADEVLFEVSTDKVDTEVPSPAAGVILEILVPEGETVAVGTPLVVIGEAGEGVVAPAAPVEIPTVPAESPVEAASIAPEPAVEPAAPVPEPFAEIPEVPAPAPEPPVLASEPFAEKPEVPAPVPEVPAPAPEPPVLASEPFAEIPEAPTPAPEPPSAPAPYEISMEVEAAGPSAEPQPAVPTDVGFLSPVVRKLASEHDIDLSGVEGTGRNGRITRKDVQGLIDARARGVEVAPPVPEPFVEAAPIAAPAAPEPAISHPPGPEPIEVPAELLEAVAGPGEAPSEPAIEPIEVLPEPVEAVEQPMVEPVEPAAAPAEPAVAAAEPAAGSPEVAITPPEPAAAPAELPPAAPSPRRAGLGKGLDALIPTEVPVPRPHPEQRVEVPPGIPLRPGDSVKDPTRLRMRIAEHMIRNRRTAAHVWTSIEVDFEMVEQVRRRHRAEFEAREGFSLTYMPFIARATIDALGAFPVVNSSFYFEERKIVEHGRVNLGIAVDLDQEGLVVMNIPGADDMRMRELARRIRAVAEKARSGDLTPDDVAGSTFTITNPGPFGTFMSVPIINVPEVAILSTDTVTKRPVAVVDETGSSAIAVHHVGYLGLTWDHRALDGSTAALFVRRIKESLETWDWEHELA